MKYPKPFEDLIECFKLLPGVGTKTAERYAYRVLEMTDEQVATFIDALNDSVTKIHYCEICGNLSSDDLCEICKDQTRDHSVICVVKDSKDIIAIEKTNEYKGMYHVLNGEISASKGVLPDDINLSSLIKRVDESVKEVILATNPTVDGETTALYIAKILQRDGLTITRLAHGLPMGGHLDYADELTLMKAMEGRKKI